MENKTFEDKRFDYFIDKIIIGQSKQLYKRRMKLEDREQLILNNEDFSTFFDNLSLYGQTRPIEETMDINNALEKLSAIEQTVLFLLYNQELEPKDAAEILKICSKSVSRIKLRALNKLKKYCKGGKYYER